MIAPQRTAHLRVALSLALIFLLVVPPQPARAYSVLSHEQVVDLAWKSQIIPLLQARYPGISREQIKRAHAFAYGGAIIQDIGYYPFGSKLLSDMLHYVRSGDFVANLIREAGNPDEYAFALGALAHYNSDAYGHPAVNRATSSEYPKLRRRYGPTVLYDQDPRAHLQTEFGFDVLEVTQQRYAPEAFHDFIGFEVAKTVFERAFLDTYGIPLNQVLTKEDLAIGTYRKTVSTLLPRMTEVAVADYGKKMQQAEPTFVPHKLIYRLNKADYQKNWGNSYQRPGASTRFFAFLLKLVPKIGPLKDLSLRVPSAEAQKNFLDGMNTVVDHYQQSLNTLKTEPPDQPSLELASVDLDTGKPTEPGEYPLADQTYARYLALLVTPRAPEPPPPPSQPFVPSPSTADVQLAEQPALGSPAAGKAAAPVVQPVAAKPASPPPQPPPPAPRAAPPTPALQPVDPAIRDDIQKFFASHPGAPRLGLKKNQWKTLAKNLDTLHQLPAAAPAATQPSSR